MKSRKVTLIIELRPEALVQLGKDINKWEELFKQKEKQVQSPEVHLSIVIIRIN